MNSAFVLSRRTILQLPLLVQAPAVVRPLPRSPVELTIPDMCPGQEAGDVAFEAFKKVSVPIDKYIFLRDLNVQQPKAYYQVLLNHTEEVLPYIYTPTVGEACERYHELPLTTRGLYLTRNDKGKILEKLKAWPQQDVKVVVVTDGERILGLGDLGANGMGITEGKITLYTAAAGVDPSQCLPMAFDVGTANQALLSDPKYKGLKQDRVSEAEFDELMAEFFAALRVWQPHMLLQFEDFGNHNAFRLLENYRHNFCCFNDDIQGTACVTLAGILSGLRAAKPGGASLKDQTILFLGAGEAGTGIGELIAQDLARRTGCTVEEGRSHCYFLDTRGLVCAERTDLQHHKIPFAHDVPFQPDLLSAVKALKPTVLVGVSTIPGSFDEEVIRTMTANIDQRPLIFPLSNPTSKAECTFQQAYDWTDGKVIFASGSPFPVITRADGKEVAPAQANNAYIFPAVGHAAILVKAKCISDEDFIIAADALAHMTPEAELEEGHLFPPFRDIFTVSATIMAAVAKRMVDSGVGTAPADLGSHSWHDWAVSKMWGLPHVSAM